MTKKFPGQQADEKVEYCTKLHWITVIPSIVFLIIILVTISVIEFFLININEYIKNLIIISNAFIIPIFIHLIFLKILNYYLNIIIITNFRIIDLQCSPLLKRDRKALDYYNIQHIEVSQKTISERLFNFGEITLLNASGEDIFIFDKVPDPLKTTNLINHIYRKAIEKNK